MAALAKIGGGRMDRRFGMASGTAATPLHLVVINDQRRCKTQRTVARAAYISRIDMSRAFAGGVIAVVAGDTGRRGFRVVKCGRFPVRRDMTGSTGVGCLRMIRALADGGCAVVAIEAGARGDAVIHDRGDIEAAWGVAGIALRRYGNMAHIFATRELAVVTSGTLGRQALKCRVDMAGFAAN